MYNLTEMEMAEIYAQLRKSTAALKEIQKTYDLSEGDDSRKVAIIIGYNEDVLNSLQKSHNL